MQAAAWIEHDWKIQGNMAICTAVGVSDIRWCDSACFNMLLRLPIRQIILMQFHKTCLNYFKSNVNSVQVLCQKSVLIARIMLDEDRH